MDNHTFFDRLATAPKEFFQNLYNRYHEDLQKRPEIRKQQQIYMDRSGHSGGLSFEARQQHSMDFLQFIVWQGWADLTIKTERDKVGLRYGTLEEKEQARELGKWFGLARGYLLTIKGSELSPSIRFREAVKLAKFWKQQEMIPDNESSESTGAANMLEVFLTLWVSRSRDVAKSLIHNFRMEGERFATETEEEFERRALQQGDTPQQEDTPAEKLTKKEEGVFLRMILHSVFRDQNDHIIYKGKLEEQIESTIAQTIGVERRQIAQWWLQLMERARFLLRTYTAEETRFPELLEEYGEPDDILPHLESRLGGLLEKGVDGWSLPERMTARHFWIQLHSLEHAISLSEKSAKGVINDWKRGVEKSNGSVFRRDLVFFWGRKSLQV